MTKPFKFSAKSETRKLDKFCREIVLARDHFTCRRCGKTKEQAQIQWCHIFTRGAKSVRWFLPNSLAQCAACHFWGHHNPMWFADFIRREILDKETFDMLSAKASKPMPLNPVVIQGVWSYLSDQAQKYGVRLP